MRRHYSYITEEEDLHFHNYIKFNDFASMRWVKKRHGDTYPFFFSRSRVILFKKMPSPTHVGFNWKPTWEIRGCDQVEILKKRK